MVLKFPNIQKGLRIHPPDWLRDRNDKYLRNGNFRDIEEQQVTVYEYEFIEAQTDEDFDW